MKRNIMHEKAMFGKSIAMLFVASMFALIAACSSTDSYAAGGVVQEPATFTLHGYVMVVHSNSSTLHHMPINVPDLSEAECIDSLAWYEGIKVNGEGLSGYGTISPSLADAVLKCSPTVKYTTNNLF